MHHPQSSGMVKRINRTFKEVLNSNWDGLLPFVLLRVHYIPYHEKFTHIK